MPIIYRQRTPSFSDAESDAENIVPLQRDTDDSIVLSDLVRTGEASRLRRRGAMRLDHGHSSHSYQQQSPTVIFVGSPSLNPETEEIQGPSTFTHERRNTRARPRQTVSEPELDYSYMIFCGSEDAIHEEESGSSSFVPSILPLYPSPSSRPPSSLPRRKRTNGCGTAIHLSAAPRRRHGIWFAKDDPTSAVIPMEEKYFDEEIASKLVTSPCGCVREGIGCAQCGNPLGVRYRCCKSASSGGHHLRNKPPAHGPVRPEGPRYWRASNNSHVKSVYTYTFFRKFVTSTTPYDFPLRAGVLETRSSTNVQERLVLREQEGHESDGLQPIYNNAIFDRVITASPAASSGEDEHTRSFGVRGVTGIPALYPLDTRTSNFSLGTYDPDGEFLDSEPNSPDKANDAGASLTLEI